MNRKDYIDKLRINIQGLPIEEVKDILSDYEEHFDIGISKGKSEEEISNELGDPREVAQGYRSNYRPSQGVKEASNYSSTDNTKKFLIALLVIGVNIIFVFGPYMAILGILLGIYGVGIGFAIGGVGLLFAAPFGFFTFNAAPHILTSISFGIGLGAAGILGIILAVFLTKLIYTLTIKYIKWNIEFINR